MLLPLGRPLLLTARFVLVCLILSGCAMQKELPPRSEATMQRGQGRVLMLPLFENETFEPILEGTLTQIFKATLFEQGWQLAPPKRPGTKVLLGRITGFGLQPIALNAVGGAREYRVVLALALVFLEAEGGPETFSMTVQGTADYIARPDPGSDRIAKDRAIREAGRQMAEQLAAALEGALDSEAKAQGE